VPELVVLLHGWPQTASAWSAVRPALEAAGYRVEAPAQRGYTPANRPAGRAAYRTELLVEDVLALAAGEDRFSVVGHDWGAVLAWWLAARHPDRLRTMTAVSVPHPAAMVRPTQALRSLYAAWFQLPAVPEATLLAGGGAVLRRALRRTGLDGARADEYVAAMREPGALTAALGWYRGASVRELTRLGSSTVPTLFVWGSRDSALGRASAEATKDHVTGPYRFEVLEGASHWIPEQHADRLVPLVLDHLGGTPPAPNLR
jgi:pimeloyl-ACP methyl ester carboxylesterase